MLTFFKDADLTRPVLPQSPKWFLFPETGGILETSLWLGNGYRSVVLETATPASGALVLRDTLELPAAGEVLVGHQKISFASKTPTLLLGIPASGIGSISTEIPAGTIVRPIPAYATTGNLAMYSYSPDYAALSAAFRSPEPGAAWNIATAPLLFPFELPAETYGLLASLSFAETAGTTAFDLSGNGNHGTLGPALNPPERVEGLRVKTKALLFDGTNYVDVPDPGFGTTGSIELWFKATEVHTGHLVQCGPLTIGVDQNLLWAEVPGTYLSEYITPTSWTHVVLTWNETTLRLYVNGQIEVLAFGVTDLSASNVRLGDLFSGRLDEVRFWSRVLHYAEVATRYNGGQGVGVDGWFEPIIKVDLRVSCSSGPVAEINGLAIEALGSDYVRAECTVYRKDQGLKQNLRILAPTRKLPDEVPGFRFGEYRWRSKDESNARTLVPSLRDADPVTIGTEKFVPGHGHADDLNLVRLHRDPGTNSIYPRIRPGEYFTGHHRYYLPQDPKLEFLPAASGAGDTFVLEDTPAPQTPVFIGRWRKDHTGNYDADVSYRYVGKRFSPAFEFDQDDLGPQFTLNRRSKQLRINHHLNPETVFLGLGTDREEEKYDLPIHPVENVRSVFANDTPRSYVSLFSLDKEKGILTVALPTSGGQTWAGKALFAECDPALAVSYDKATPSKKQTRLLTEVDINPAFSGVSRGHLYLQHRRWKPSYLQLYADKPRITTPGNSSTDPDLVSFGPVYYENDYALLLVTAHGNNESEKVPGVRLQVHVEEGFQGLLNYQDPNTETVEVLTGADGSASLVYTPNKGYGTYLDPIASASGDMLVLPEAIPLSKVWNALDTPSFKVLTYAVRNDDPYLGKLNADADRGELPWETTGTPGTADYITNGRRVLLRRTDGSILYPDRLLDAFGREHTDPAFNGLVKTLIYPQDLPTDVSVGSFFVSYVGQIKLWIESVEHGIKSNSILLQLAFPTEIVDPNEYIALIPSMTGYLIHNDSVSGRLNVNRLAGGPLIDIQFSRRI